MSLKDNLEHCSVIVNIVPHPVLRGSLSKGDFCSLFNCLIKHLLC